MGIELIAYSALIMALRAVRFCLMQLMLIQRMPFLLMGAFFLGVGRVCYAAFGWHRWFVQGIKWTLRVAFFFRGIRVVVDAPTLRRLDEGAGIHICNDAYLAQWLLFSVAPYRQLIISPDAFFSDQWLRPLLFLLGFYPQEHGLRPENFKTVASRLDPYLAQGFSVWQPVYMDYRETEPLPYGVIMALKHGRPVHVWKFHDIQGLDGVHWLKRRRVRLECLTQVAISRRHALTISAYYQTIQQHFGPPLTQRMTSLSQAPGMPPSSREIATAVIERSKRMSRESENEAPSP